MSWREKGDIKKALEELGKIDPRAEEFIMALKQMTLIYIKLGTVDQGIRTITDYLPAMDKKPEIYILLSMLYEEKNDFAAGINALEEARRIEPKNLEVLYQIGMLHEKKGESDKALAIMDDVLGIDPEYPNALNFVGYSLAEKGIRLDEAETMIRKALAKRPDDGYIIDSLGWVFYKKGDLKAALQEIRKASSLMPDDPTIHEHLGDIYAALKDYDKALVHYEKSVALEKDPSKRNSVKEKLKMIKEKN
jgi:tetratricopeptide (TPR) repeat protein